MPQTMPSVRRTSRAPGWLQRWQAYLASPAGRAFLARECARSKARQAQPLTYFDRTAFVIDP